LWIRFFIADDNVVQQFDVENFELLSVSRATIWRMTKDCVLQPVEILPGTWRYPFHEIARLARGSAGAPNQSPRRQETASAI
jgi:hypothetical protein